MFKNIQSKLVFLYFCLVLIIMIVVGTFLINQIESFYYSDYVRRVDSAVKNSKLPYHRVSNVQELNKNVSKLMMPRLIDGIDEHYFILDNKGKVLMTDYQVQKKTIMTGPAVRKAMVGQFSTVEGKQALVSGYIEYAAPIYTQNDNKYILYIRSNERKITPVLKTIKQLIVYATAAGLMISVFLGFLLAKTITNPIKDLTVKAKEIASGNFERRIKVKSRDEIGMLTATFNHMAGQLKRNLDEISTQKNKVETILTNLADGVIAFDIDGDIIHINDAAERMLYLDESNREDYNFADLFTDLDIDIQFDEIFSLSKEDKIVRLWNYRDFIIKIYISAFRDEYENIFGGVAVFQDITEQYKLDNMRKEFVANVSHELRTPITTIKSYSETLIDGAIDDKEVAMDFLGTINSETDRMTKLINDLLELSKYDYKYAKLDFNEFDIVNMVKGCIDKLVKLAADKKQNIKYNLHDNHIIINGDKDRLEQVIINIISNSIKYTPESGIIEVGINELGDDIEISIKDNGIGMSKEDKERIFERFYRVDKARSRAMGGTGLGLSIAREIVDAHGGRIEVYSELNIGTEMKIIIPKGELM